MVTICHDMQRHGKKHSRSRLDVIKNKSKNGPTSLQVAYIL
jgi:hypothetical protein